MLPPTPSPSPPPAAIMSGATAISPTSASATTSTPTIEEELTTALHEALTCTGCTTILRIPKSTFRADTASGRYDPARTVPFNPAQADPDLAPHELPPATSSDDDEMDLEADDAVHSGPQARCRTQESPKSQVEQQHRYISYAELTPPSTPPSSSSVQGHLYEALVARYLLEGEDDTSDDGSNSEDVAFAKYRADYHIHVHYTLRRGTLSICRDGKDVYELKGWKGRLHAVDSGLIDLEELESGMMDWRYGIIREKGGGGTVGKGEGGYYSSNPYQSYYPAPSPMAALPRTQKLGGWPDDANQLMASQVALWRKRGLNRQRRVEDVRIRWAFIMEERRRQRLAALAQAQQHKATSSVKVRLYCSQAGGDRNLIREIEMDGRSFGELIT
ncbi:uncharacterized protein BO66DRAFT_48565 [Aspergillus aculeatinus CBS 121060]|uniref:Uncharacterized protein n=1 Tax=Aspergillus aculeatinus CBS 121060 TaxID=1448322 RepID=A0ACD1HE77_9EURO|nr:hypothetical protein BO66DRAFT_48565 [Aspergillus aculeatinus CBS 121060]RAH71775.1 hypothetical protein BO66DRAFT_48565 [Aspergillus aculeatinus CBS 121060]